MKPWLKEVRTLVQVSPTTREVSFNPDSGLKHKDERSCPRVRGEFTKVTACASKFYRSSGGCQPGSTRLTDSSSRHKFPLKKQGILGNLLLSKAFRKRNQTPSKIGEK